MRRYALIGEKLGHSLSVPIHEAIFRALGVEAEYRLIEIPRGALAERFASLRQSLDGFNVTLPYKKDIMPLLDAVDAFAARVGAVNTVALRGGRTVGYNTDVAGFIGMLQRCGLEPRDGDAYILGTGGASEAACAALDALGAKSVVRVSRHPSGGDIGYDALPERFSGLLVNCTPVGMFPRGEDCPLTPAQLERILPRCTGVADMIYNPAQTCLTRAAEAAGVPACTGLYMLVRQAVEAEALWQECPLGDAFAEAIMREIART